MTVSGIGVARHFHVAAAVGEHGKLGQRLHFDNDAVGSARFRELLAPYCALGWDSRFAAEDSSTIAVDDPADRRVVAYLMGICPPSSPDIHFFLRELLPSNDDQ